MKATRNGDVARPMLGDAAAAEIAMAKRYLDDVALRPDDRDLAADRMTLSMQLSLDELAAHVHDETAWDARLALLQRLHGVWQRQGVLTMLRQTPPSGSFSSRSTGQSA